MAIFGIYSQAWDTASPSSRLSPFYHSILTKGARWSQRWHPQGNVSLSSPSHQVRRPRAQHCCRPFPKQTARVRAHKWLLTCPWHWCPAGRVTGGARDGCDTAPVPCASAGHAWLIRSPPGSLYRSGRLKISPRNFSYLKHTHTHSAQNCS